MVSCDPQVEFQALAIRYLAPQHLERQLLELQHLELQPLELLVVSHTSLHSRLHLIEVHRPPIRVLRKELRLASFTVI